MDRAVLERLLAAYLAERLDFEGIMVRLDVG